MGKNFLSRDNSFLVRSSFSSCPCGEQFAGIEEVLFSFRSLQDQFALWVEPYCGAGLDFAFL